MNCQTCELCKFWKRKSDQMAWGYCQRNVLPVHGMGPNVGTNAVTFDRSSCGLWQANVTDEVGEQT